MKEVFVVHWSESALGQLAFRWRGKDDLEILGVKFVPGEYTQFGPELVLVKPAANDGE